MIDEWNKKASNLRSRVEDTCKWLESGPSVLCRDMAHNIRAYVNELEARVVATEDNWRERQNESRELLAKKDKHIEDCHDRVEEMERQLELLRSWDRMMCSKGHKTITYLEEECPLCAAKAHAMELYDIVATMRDSWKKLKRQLDE